MARTALETIAEAGIGWGMLHGWAQLEAGVPFGDIDVVVDIPPRDLLLRIGLRLADRGAWPVLLWPYDVGGSASLFLMNPTATGGAQIDMLHDPRGRGRYGLRSREFQIDETIVPARVRPVDELVYLAAKRLRKAQMDQLADVRAQAVAVGAEFNRAFDRLVASPSLARSFGQALPKKVPIRWAGEVADRAVRLAERLTRPVGFWVHSHDPAIARDLADRFSRVLTSRGELLPSGPGRRAAWYLTSVAPLRWRAGLFVSWGPLDTYIGPQPDLILPVRDLNDPSRAAASTVQAMCARMLRTTGSTQRDSSKR